MSALHLRIVGRVQGVGFREAMRREAQQLGITGWVRNRTDGTVESVIASNDAAAVSAMLDWCRMGPPLARVEKVEQTVTTDNASSFITRPSE